MKMSSHLKSVSFIGSILAILNVVVMIIVTASVYKNIENKDRLYSYVWWMMIPIAFSTFAAVLFAGGCIVPHFPRSGRKVHVSENSEIERTTPDSIFIQERSGYQVETREIPSRNATYEESSSSSRSFFASGETEIQLGQVTPFDQHGAISKLKSKSLSPHASQAKFDRKRTYDESTCKSKQPMQRERFVSDSEIVRTKVTYELPRATSTYISGHSKEHFSSSKGNKEMRIRTIPPYKQEKNPLLEKTPHQPISILKDSVSYGATGFSSSHLHPIQMYEFIPRFGESREIGRPEAFKQSKSAKNKSPDIETGETWSFVEYKPPVFYFSPAKDPKQKETKVQEIQEIKNINPRVELKLPKVDAAHRVTDWLKKSTLKETESTKTQRVTIENKSLVPTKAETSAREHKEEYKSNLSTPQKRQLTDKKSDSVSKAAKTEMNKFCILGRGYFYATETNDYLPVELSITDENKALAASVTADTHKSKLSKKK